MSSYHLPVRMQRLRSKASVRNLVQETRLHPHQFIAPLIVHEGLQEKKPITSMPGQFQFPLQSLEKEVAEIASLNIPAVLVFGIPQHKDTLGSSAWQEQGVVQKAIQIIKKSHPELLIIADVCFCQYTSHGHCGILEQDCLANDKTLALLEQQTLSLVQAGADWLAPSGMIDGMVSTMRKALDTHGYSHAAILSYAVKYCSHLYGPFAQATEGAAKIGDRKTYQMNPANREEGVREADLDIQEGADALMVKPALHFLDVIYRIKQRYPEIPLCAYQVSGEYSLIKYGAQQGLFQEERAILEAALSIKRAGADMIISYFAKDIARLLKDT